MTAVPPKVKDEIIRASSQISCSIISRNQIEDIIAGTPEKYPYLLDYGRSDRRRFISCVMNQLYPVFYESKKPKLPKWVVEASHAANS